MTSTAVSTTTSCRRRRSVPTARRRRSRNFAFDRLGLRVPAVLVSPLIKSGTVDSTLYDHTSLLATVRELFGLPKPLTNRDAQANTFTHLLDNAAADAISPP